MAQEFMKSGAMGALFLSLAFIFGLVLSFFGLVLSVFGLLSSLLRLQKELFVIGRAFVSHKPLVALWAS